MNLSLPRRRTRVETERNSRSRKDAGLTDRPKKERAHKTIVPGEITGLGPKLTVVTAVLSQVVLGWSLVTGSSSPVDVPSSTRSVTQEDLRR